LAVSTEKAADDFFVERGGQRDLWLAQIVEGAW